MTTREREICRRHLERAGLEIREEIRKWSRKWDLSMWEQAHILIDSVEGLARHMVLTQATQQTQMRASRTTPEGES